MTTLPDRSKAALLVIDDYSQYGAPPAEQVIAHTNLYWRFQAAPGRQAGVVESASVEFTAPPAGPTD